MNAGAWGVELKDIILSVTFLDDSGKVIERSRAELGFSYRGLNLPPSWVILRGGFI